MQKTLLIVDDSRVSRIMIKGMIAERRPDWQILEAASGDEAIQMTAENMPDYITMDLNMPKMDGMSAAAQIKKTYPKTRIVLLTANVQESSRERAKQIGVDFVSKPITATSIDQLLIFCEKP